MLKHSLAKLSVATKADSDNIFSTKNIKKGKDSSDKNMDKEFKEKVSESFNKLARNQTIN